MRIWKFICIVGCCLMFLGVLAHKMGVGPKPQSKSTWEAIVLEDSKGPYAIQVEGKNQGDTVFDVAAQFVLDGHNCATETITETVSQPTDRKYEISLKGKETTEMNSLSFVVTYKQEASSMGYVHSETVELVPKRK